MWPNFGLSARIRQVAAGRDVEIVQLDAARQHGDGVAAVDLAAPVEAAWLLERNLRENRDAMVAGLAVQQLVLEAERPQLEQRKQVVADLGLLQAEHVRVDLAHQPAEPVEAQADRVDVPGRDAQRTGWPARVAAMTAGRGSRRQQQAVGRVPGDPAGLADGDRRAGAAALVRRRQVIRRPAAVST